MDRHLTVADVSASARRLIARYPGAGRLRRVGTSRAGRPLEMLSVGHGPHHVLVVARPHPDEPVGAATALALAERVVRGDGRTAATDPTRVTWDIVLCLDPDGAALSEGIEQATAGPAPSVEHYFRSAFRPVAAEQPEWAPIVPRHLPESQALFDLIDTCRPVLQCSLHGIEAGGTFVQLTDALPDLAAPFHTAAADLSVPVQHGTFDALHWENPAPGVHVLPPPEHTARLAAGSENIGRSTWCAPQRYGGVTAIVEVPMWASALADDPSPHPDPVGALRGLSRLVRDGGEQVTAVLDKARGLLPPAAGERAPARTGVDGGRPVRPGRRLLGALGAAGRRGRGAADHVAGGRPGRGGPPSAAPRGGAAAAPAVGLGRPGRPVLHDGLHALFTAWCADFAQALALRWVPVRDQVHLQSRTVLAAAECAVRAAHR